MKVLIAEDKKTWHKLLEIVLSLRGIDVLHAHTPGEAINKAVSEKPDAAVVDLTLSNGTAYDVIKEITDFGVPVIVIGYRAEGLDPERAKSLGAYEVLEKPFTVEDLLSVLRKLKGEEPALAVEEKTSLVVPEGEEVKGITPKEEEIEVVGLEENPIETIESEEPSPLPLEEVKEEVEEELKPQSKEVVKEAEKSVDKGIPEVSQVSLPPEEVKEIVREATWEVIPEIAEKVIREEVEKPVREATWEVIPEIAEKVIREEVEKLVREVAWEVIPEIAEKVIREEFEKLIKSRLA